MRAFLLLNSTLGHMHLETRKNLVELPVELFDARLLLEELLLLLLLLLDHHVEQELVLQP